MGYIDMKYFELIGDTENVVIDDNFECLELIDSFPLSQCTKVAGSYDTYYRYPRTVNGILYGISIGGLAGKQWFSFDADSNTIRFYGQGSNVQNIGMVSVARDDIIANATLYVYGISNRLPSEHLDGIEIYNAEGKVVFSSDCEYLNTIACGSDYTETITFSNNAIIFNLGYDRSCDYYNSPHLGIDGFDYTLRARFDVQENSVSISRVSYGTLWHEFSYDELEWYDDIEHYFEAWLGYGWLIASI